MGRAQRRARDGARHASGRHRRSTCRCSGPASATASTAGRLSARLPGAYEIAVDADRDGKPIGTNTAYVRAGAGDAEYFDPTMHEAPLRASPDETGGRFYTTANVAGLAEDVSYAGRGVTSVEERELWNMPIILIMLVGLVCAEWGYRRAVGLS